MTTPVVGQSENAFDSKVLNGHGQESGNGSVPPETNLDDGSPVRARITAEIVFAAEDEPFTLLEIAEALNVPYKRLHYSYKVLTKRPATKAKVKPLDGRRPLYFTAQTANLITRNCPALRRARKSNDSE